MTIFTDTSQEAPTLTLEGREQIETAQEALRLAGVNWRLQITLGGVLSQCVEHIETAVADGASEDEVKFTWNLQSPPGVQAREDVLISLGRAEELPGADPAFLVAARSLHHALSPEPS